jgi:N-glycosylase/DNA lyase
MEDLRLMIVHLEKGCPFDLDLTLCCGQTFRWDKEGEWWHGAIGESSVKIRQQNDSIRFYGATMDDVMTFLGLKDNLVKIYSEIDRDRHIRTAFEQFRGLRILRQTPWESLISYICATYKNIASIKRMLHNLSRQFGERIRTENQDFFTFPTPQKLAKASISDLRRCELGYRAEYVLQTSKQVFENNYDLDSLKKTSYDDARTFLLQFPGVGPKVADCVLLFGLGRLEAFPVDVWMRRVMLRHYASHFPKKFVTRISEEESLSEPQYKELNRFGREYFGKYAGYAQEYLYHYERMNARKQR